MEDDNYIKNFIEQIEKEQKSDHKQIARYNELMDELSDRISKRSLILNKLEELV